MQPSNRFLCLCWCELLWDLEKGFHNQYVIAIIIDVVAIIHCRRASYPHPYTYARVYCLSSDMQTRCRCCTLGSLVYHFLTVLPTLQVIHAILASWVPPPERATCVTLASGGQALGTILAMLTSPLADLHWPSIFYIFGCMGFVWCLLAMMYLVDTPAEHMSITADEQDYIVLYVWISVIITHNE